MSVSLAAKIGLAVVLVGSAIAYQGYHAASETVTQTEFLERLASRVERANTLSPQARAVVSHVIERSRSEPARLRVSAKNEARRQQAITRLENALQTIPADDGAVTAAR
jgi:hypothetical protein